MLRIPSTLVRVLLVIALGAGALTAGGLAIAPSLAGLRNVSTATAPPIDFRDLNERTFVYDRVGQLIAVLRAEENRQSVSIDAVPSHVIDAILAVEDAEFWNHDGFNVRATIRALVSNVESGDISQGGSTITQQLIKNALVGSEQTIERKLEEAFLAVRLEKQMEKEQILERYLNTVYFGNSAYGVQAASETYFGKSVGEIDVGEAALLAGLIRDPIDYNPFQSSEIAAERRRIALGRLVAENKITESDKAFYEAAPLPTAPIEYVPPPDTYFVEEVKQQLLKDVSLGETATERYDAVFRGGLHVHTTFDQGMQFLSEVSRNNVMAPFAVEGSPAMFVAGTNQVGEEALGTVAFATVQTQTGAVRAVVGGPGFGDSSKFNLATQGYRQPGSAFKTFVLLTLLQQGRAPQDTVSGVGPCKFDIPGVDEDYEVNNFGNSRGSVGSIVSMTLSSSNCAYVRLGQIAGIPNVVRLAGELGIETRNAANEIVPLSPSIFSTPLGTQEVTPLDMAAAYAAIGNGGIFNEPYFIERIEDRNGEILFEHEAAGVRVLSEDTAAIAADILRRNVLGGTGGRARIPGHDAGGKTGTTQDFSNAWFAGFTSHYSSAIWMGAIEGNVSMRRVGGRSVTGGSWPAAIWGQYMTLVHDIAEPIPFPRPPSRRGTGELKVDKEIDISPRPRPVVTRPPAPTTTAAPVVIAPDPTPSTTASTTTAPPPPTDVGD